MATVEEQIAALESAIARGVQRTRFGDEEVQYHSLEDMERVLARLKRTLNTTRNFRLASTSKGID